MLQAGDLYEGVPVTSVLICAEALNNLGQIVMIVQSRESGDVRGPDVRRQSHASKRRLTLQQTSALE